ncbi:MAG: GH3 auxin-responsive promoter family protein [Pirellulales bacterium]|nr:GH3 auxin-responsive promoter family protein [Pirellulales bacterium]
MSRSYRRRPLFLGWYTCFFAVHTFSSLRLGRSVIVRLAYLAWLRANVRRFVRNASRARKIQHEALLQKIRRNADSQLGRDFGFASIRSAAEFRARVPIMSYEDHRPYINRVLHGDVTALFAPGTKVLMFAMTSGTTGDPKRLPMTEELFREYRRGWQLWGGGVYGDYPRLLYKKTLQLTSDWQQLKAPCGIPCGQISGLAATTRPAIADIMFLPPSATIRIHDSAAKHYAALRFSLASRNIGMIVTANPSSLVEFARRADSQREALIRDIFDGTLSCEIPVDVRATLARRIAKRSPRRARQLERLVETHGTLLPRHVWPKLSMLATWTGGSIGIFLPRLAELYGQTAVRDHGLSASEGRMTIPLADGTPAGMLDYCHHYFEFIPVEEYGSHSPTVLEGHELELGRDYFILLTTSGGLYRYDIHDAVRCVGFQGQAPVLEFLNKGKNFSNLTGEKLSENQVIRAVERSIAELGLTVDFFTLAPVMEDRPRYVLLVERSLHRGRAAELAASVQKNLVQLNEEYQEKCASGRLLPVQVREVSPGTWARMRAEKTDQRGNFEEYKHICLVQDLTFAAQLHATQPTAEPDRPCLAPPLSNHAFFPGQNFQAH